RTGDYKARKAQIPAPRKEASRFERASNINLGIGDDCHRRQFPTCFFPLPAMSVRACCESFRVPGRRYDRREVTTSANQRPSMQSDGGIPGALNPASGLQNSTHEFSTRKDVVLKDLDLNTKFAASV